MNLKVTIMRIWRYCITRSKNRSFYSFTANIQIAQLAMKGYYHMAQVQLVGWGMINKERVEPSAVLKYVNVTQVDRSREFMSTLKFKLWCIFWSFKLMRNNVFSYGLVCDAYFFGVSSIPGLVCTTTVKGNSGCSVSESTFLLLLSNIPISICTYVSI